MELGDFFEPSETIAETHSWTLLRHDSDVFRSEILAEILADRIIQLLCRGCPQHYRAWRQCIDGDSSLSDASRSAISVFIRRGLGLPEEPNPPNHLIYSIHHCTIRNLLYSFISRFTSDRPQTHIFSLWAAVRA